MRSNSSSYKELILLGNLTLESLDLILYESHKIYDIGMRIDSLSRQFIGTPYQESTLIGDLNTPEVFVINLEAVDCFTFIDYIEAMRLSSSFQEFKGNLKRLRYKGGKVSFLKRNHFFINWIESNSEYIVDVTEQIGGKTTLSSKKILNKKDDGTHFLPGIPIKDTLIHYIPAKVLNESILKELRTGDYIGIYSKEKWLDVSHVGIFIQEGDKTYLRHASSVKKKVVDDDFEEYIIGKPGIIIFRSKDDKS
ncbi:MAG: N-acetylmuramoyl-L-alanine amidase-like domain-containing protein [Thermodesulfovibrionales bacterium]